MEAERIPLLVIDDDELSRATLSARPELLGYRVHTATTGAQGLELLQQRPPALVLIGVEVADLSVEEMLQLRETDPNLADVPILVIAGPTDTAAVSSLIELGAEDYITKPFDTFLLRARIGGSLERKRLREVERSYQAIVNPATRGSTRVRARRDATEAERLARLRRFVSPQLAEIIVNAGDEGGLDSHRREIVVAFCDLRGFTAFTDSSEPEDVMGVLREYHTAMGQEIFRHEGTLERFAGDGMMVFFNDPVPVDDPAGQATRMAVAMREQAIGLEATWRSRGHDLGFGMGVAMGYATLGRIGFEGRYDYGAIGSVTNMAARLCDQAAAGQILINRRVWSAVEKIADAELVGRLELKGFQRPIEAYNVTGLKGRSK